MIRKFILWGLVTSAVIPNILFAAPTQKTQTNTNNHLFQVSTLYALEAGIFEGDFYYRDLMKKGDLGIGTFTAIDGEMVAIDGQYFQSTPDCHLQKFSPDLKAPFAEVIHFQPVISADINNVSDLVSLDHQLSAKFPNKNLPYAIRIDGTFDITVRSLRKQKPPFPHLVVAMKEQGVLSLTDVKGTAVGFWFPHYWEGIGMPGIHLHFANEDRQLGGHVLKIAVKQGKAQMQPVKTVEVALPETKTFANAELDIDKLEGDLQKSEGEVH